MIASRLSQNQKLEEARKWFHYIFDPTKPSNSESTAKRFWITKPFKKEIDAQITSIEDLINVEDNQAELITQLKHWEDHPFNPHAVARLRYSAYMRSTVMKYIDNLNAWGDQLFRRDTIESINEATHLYVLAANLLGIKPENVPPRAKPVENSFDTLKDKLNAFSMAKVAIESFIDNTDLMDSESSSDPIQMSLFCLPKNDKLLSYWDNITDKLFKIRNCMNIDGVVRELPLFEPAIDPALLVRAAAAGLNLNSVLNDLQAVLPHYRFQVMLQKANELCNEVKSLGSQFLSTLEKKDAEELSLLRSTHEIKLLELMRDIKKRQIEEANENFNVLNCTKKVIEERKNYYSSRPFKNDKESFHLESLNHAALYQILQGANDILASILFTVPDVTVGAWSWGAKSGGTHAAGASKAISTSLGVGSNFEMTQGNIASVEGGYRRRQEDWDFQTKTATLELKQIEKQIIAAEIRLAIAEKDLSNHEVQMEHSRNVDDYMRSKFTHMVTQLSGIHFQTYQMAFDLAKKAEKCYQFELGTTEGNFIKFGHWDSLKKGLLAGEKLQFDLRHLESSFMDSNKRELELSKHISLKLLSPLDLIQLKETGKCFLALPEELFDQDYPGHYFRRIKSISISLPCIAGPYTTISCSLRLLENNIRIATGGNAYPQNGPEDDRFTPNHIPVKSVATSAAQNDSGVFELNFRDERYLPFEGAGVISHWAIDLFHDDEAEIFGKSLRQFDYSTISDAILHVKYTSKEGPEDFKKDALKNLRDYYQADGPTASLKIINFKHDFPSEWNRFLHSDNPVLENVLRFKLTANLFPFRDRNQDLKINTVTLISNGKNEAAYTARFTTPSINLDKMEVTKDSEFGSLHHTQKNVSQEINFNEDNIWNIEITSPADVSFKKEEIEDLFLILGYSWKNQAI